MESDPEWKWSGTEHFKWLSFVFLFLIGLLFLVAWLRPA
jgi:hypothetical protein